MPEEKLFDVTFRRKNSQCISRLYQIELPNYYLAPWYIMEVGGSDLN